MDQPRDPGIPGDPMEKAKCAAAARALLEVGGGMRLGLGTGSTANWFVKLLGQKIRQDGLKLFAVPTSKRTEALARSEGIPVLNPDEFEGPLDLVVDGADEFDADCNLVKGAGGALLREKIVAAAAKRMIVIADDSKGPRRLGGFPVPVEVAGFGWRSTSERISAALAELGHSGCTGRLRMSGDSPYATDQGNPVLDFDVGPISDPFEVSAALDGVPGVMEHGLFCGLCELVLVGRADGSATAVART